MHITWRYLYQSKAQTHTHLNKKRNPIWDRICYLYTGSFHDSSSQFCPFRWPFALSLICGLCICGLLLKGTFNDLQII